MFSLCCFPSTEDTVLALDDLLGATLCIESSVDSVDARSSCLLSLNDPLLGSLNELGVDKVGLVVQGH